jgi:glycosyltransferase involved in cell wall biosynthesis
MELEEVSTLAEGSLRVVLAANARPHVGGQGLNFAQFVEALSSRFDLTVFGQAGHPESPGYVIPESRLAHCIGKLPVVRRLTDLRTQLSNSHFDRCVAARMPRADVFQGVTGQCLDSLRRARQLGAFTILDCITTHIDDLVEQQVAEGRRFGIRPLVNSAAREMAINEYSSAALIRVMSDYAKQTLLNRGIPDSKLYVARPPLAVDDFPVADFREPRFRVIFVGMLVPAKGFHYLIDAFRELPGRDSELVLWTGPGHRSIKRYIQREMALDTRIQMLPASVRHNYGKVYGKSNVLVHPSLADGYSYAVMEAMASGLPVIVTSCTGSAELIRDGENGYVVPPRDSGAIRERLQHLSHNPALVRRMGTAARATIQSQTPEAFRDRYAARIESAVSGRVSWTT